MTVPLDDVNDIRAMDAAGVPRAEIARRLGLSRNTVAKYADMADMPPAAPEARARRRRALSREDAAWVDALLEADLGAPRKLMWLMWLYLIGQSDESLRALRGKGAPCGAPSTPRQLTEDFRRQIVALVDSGKPRVEAMREHGLGKSAPGRWTQRVHARGSTAAADNRAPGQDRLIELGRENAGLEMGVDVNLPRFHLHFLTPRRRRLSGSSPRTPRG